MTLGSGKFSKFEDLKYIYDINDEDFLKYYMLIENIPDTLIKDILNPLNK